MSTQETITVNAGCKVNLYLKLTGRLDNGYHTLESLFLPLPEPGDELTLAFGPLGGGFTLTASAPELETDSNTVARAWREFTEATGFAPKLDVHLEKRVPTGAGLGGGSADAAVVLRELNARAGDKALPHPELSRMAASIGADVPFFLQDGAAWAEGIGDDLTPVDLDLKGLSLLLLCPGVHVSTAWAYRTWDDACLGHTDRPENRRGFLTCGKDQFKSSRCFNIPLLNSFEEVVFPAHPKLRRYKEKLLSSGAAGAVMSGSGASIVGLFRDHGQAEKCYHSFDESSVTVFLHRF